MYWSPGVRGNWLAEAPGEYGPPEGSLLSGVPQSPQKAGSDPVSDRHLGHVTRATPGRRPAAEVSGSRRLMA